MHCLEIKMRITNDGYATRYTRDRVIQCAKALRGAILAARREHGEDIAVVVRGNSGVSAAFAAMIYLDFPLILSRKPGENSHGGAIEGPYNFTLGKYIIADDFVSSGATIRSVLQSVAAIASSRCDPSGIPQCVGLALYASQTRGCTIVPYGQTFNDPCLGPYEGLTLRNYCRADEVMT